MVYFNAEEVSSNHDLSLNLTKVLLLPKPNLSLDSARHRSALCTLTIHLVYLDGT